MYGSSVVVLVMLGKHPLDLALPGKEFSSSRVGEALRLAIIAELDAINLYLQLAERIGDERIRRVFLDIAREEKTHVGEFLALLKNIDPEQVEELKAGAEEVEELTGIKTPSDPPREGENNGGESGDFIGKALKNALSFMDKYRVFRKHLPVTVLGPGVEAVLVWDKVEGRVKPLLLHEYSTMIRIPQRLIEAASRSGDESLLTPVYEAVTGFALGEDKLILMGTGEFTGLLNTKGTKTLNISDWSQPGRAVEDVANALKTMGENGIVPPYKLFLNPALYAELVKVHEKTGMMELERVKKLVDEVVVLNSLDPDTALLVAASKQYLDIVYGVDTRLDYIGPENGFQVYRLWETITLRVKEPAAILLLKKTG